MADDEGTTNIATFDAWTLVHGAAGLLASRVGLSWPEAMSAALGVEAVEVALSESVPSLARESRKNQLSDMVVFVAAFYVANRFRRPR